MSINYEEKYIELVCELKNLIITNEQLNKESKELGLTFSAIESEGARRFGIQVKDILVNFGEKFD